MGRISEARTSAPAARSSREHRADRYRNDRTIDQCGSPWRRVRLWAGARRRRRRQVPASPAVPYFALQWHFSYV